MENIRILLVSCFQSEQGEEAVFSHYFLFVFLFETLLLSSFS
jgi:hypothetical protein